MKRSTRRLVLYVLIYRYSPAVSVLIDELARYKRRIVILEENEDTARRLHEEGLEVIRRRRALDELSFEHIGPPVGPGAALTRQPAYPPRNPRSSAAPRA